MDSIRKVRIKHEDGSYSESIPIGANSDDIVMSTGGTLTDNIKGIEQKVNNIKISNDNQTVSINNLITTTSEHTNALADQQTINENQQRQIDAFQKALAQERVYVFNNVVEMKNSNKLLEGMYCVTKGYYGINDGGNGKYLIRTKKSSDIEDNGSIHFIGTNLVAELIIDEVYPEIFGAKGDGETNDAQAFGKALKFSNSLKLNSKTYNLGQSTIDLKNLTTIEIIGKNRNSVLLGGTFLVNLNSDWTRDKNGNTATQPANVLHIEGVKWNKQHQSNPGIVCGCPVLFENCQIFYYNKFLSFPNACYVDRVNFLECNFYISQEDYNTGTLVIGCDGVNQYSDWKGEGDDWCFKNCSMAPIYNQIPLFHVSHGMHGLTFENCINPTVCYGSDSDNKDLPEISFNNCHLENTHNPCYPKEGYANNKALVVYTNCYFHSYVRFNFNDLFLGLNYYCSKAYNFRPEGTPEGMSATRLNKFNGVLVPYGSKYKHKKDYSTTYKIPTTKTVDISSQTSPTRRIVSALSDTMDYVIYYGTSPFAYDITTKITKSNVTPNINNFNLWYVNVSENTYFYLHFFRINRNTGKKQKCVVYVGASWCIETNFYTFEDGGNTIEGLYIWEDYDGDFPEM